MVSPNEMMEHHPWCNYYTKPREGCKMCKRFFKLYPVTEDTHEKLIAKYFPEAEVIPKPKDVREGVIMERIPKREIGDRVRVMDTTTARQQGLANKRGVITFKESGYIMKEKDTGKLFCIPGYLLAEDEDEEV